MPNEKLHQYDEHGLEKTKNQFGFMHRLSNFTKKFIAWAQNAKAPLLDIGAAYGVTTIPCLEQGSHVFACDIHQEHLEILQQRTPQHLYENLRLIQARFPDELHFAHQSIGGALFAHVFSFLNGDEIERGLEKLFSWLTPGGKVFVLNYTPYYSSMQRFIPIYEERCQRGEIWPGYINDRLQYDVKEFTRNSLPSTVNLMDIDILTRVFNRYGFIIEYAERLNGKNENIPDIFYLDGRELVGLIARKP